MEDRIEIIETFAKRFQKELSKCPLVKPSFYNTFDYTRTGNNYSHPRTLGLLVRACYSLPEVAVVDVDVHLNEGRNVKFQPDVMALDNAGHCMLVLDFESPNSSDARIPEKDVEPYLRWNCQQPGNVPYLIITSLPKKVVPPRPRLSTRRYLPRPHGNKQWELRYTSPGGCNEEHLQYKDEIESEPYTYWYHFYRKKLEELSEKYDNLSSMPFFFANLDGVTLSLVDVMSF